MQRMKIDKSVVLLVLGIVMALFAGFFVVKGQEYYNKLVPVIYCGEKDIPPYTKIKEEDIVELKLPQIVAQKQRMFLKKEEVIGKVSKALIIANTPIINNQILDVKNNSNILASNLTQIGDPRLVAYTIPANPMTSVGGKILPNDKVHIIANIQIRVKDQEDKKRVSKIIVPYAKVIDTVGKEASIRGLTFAMTPQQVLDVEYALKNGSISFALLPYEYNKDQENISTSDESFTERHISTKGE